ncbi:BOS complex subunit ncln-like [Ciona intestinalis]
MLEEAFEAIRSGFPLVLLAVVPAMVLIISPIAVVDAAHEFTVYRMQQYDLQGNSYGCKSAAISAEARTIDSSSIARKCVLLRADEVAHGKYLEVLDRGPSSVVILLQSNMSKEEVQRFISFEAELLALESNIPVYFAYENEDLKDVYSRVSHSTKQESGSALQAVVDSATSVGYQLVTVSPQNKALPDQKIVNIQGVLHGLGVEDQLPAIVLVAHYDSFGVAPMLSTGANSGSTGAVAMLEIARILGKLYSNSRTHPRYNVLFLLSGGGKFNYQGSRKWIEDAADTTGSSSLSNTKLVLCMEALGSEGSNSLQMHVSKPPSTSSVAHSMYSYMEKAVESHPDYEMSMVHKKIRLSSDSLSWEHERFSIRRLHAATLSSLAEHSDPARRSILDTKDQVSVDNLVRNIGIITDSLIRQLYNISHNDTFDLMTGDLSVQRDRVQSWLEFLSSQARPAQVMGEDHAVVTALATELSNHVRGVQKVAFKADKRDPEFMFYDGLSFQMSASIVRSAVFDLYVTVLVAGYITTIYFFVMKFNLFLSMVKKVGAFQKIKVH